MNSPGLANALDAYFGLTANQSSWRTEILAGCTTFVTMAYIIAVNPAILRDAGMPVAATTAATCLAAALGCFLMGGLARYPIALAPGMGLNAYFTYSVVQGMKVPWPVALGAVFLSGIAFLLLTATGIRQRILASIPAELHAAVACGIGFFITLIGFRNAGLVVSSPATLVTLGDLHQPGPLLAFLGLAVTAALMSWRMPGAMLIGVAVTTAAAALTGHAPPVTAESAAGAGLTDTWLKLNIPGALSLGAAEIIFVFLFVDLFDNVGTLVAVGKRAGLFHAADPIPRIGKVLTADAVATVGGSLLGTSTVVSYIESAAGVAAGGRTGVTAIVAGLLFLCALPFAPVAAGIPGAATAPALILVGSLMMAHASEIPWADPEAAIPAFLTLATIPFSFSIANGLATGFLAYVVLKIGRGKARTVPLFVYGMAALFLLRFVLISAA